MISIGVDVDWFEVGRDGYTALHLSCEAGMHDVVKLLLSRASSLYDTATIIKWLSEGTSDIRVTSSTFQAGGRTPLHIAAHRGYFTMVAHKWHIIIIR
jgi:ankyrin repeat protein